MTSDPHERAALQRAFQTSVDLEVLLTGEGGSVLTYILQRARLEAEDAMQRLVIVSADDHAAVRTLQNEVLRHRQLVDWLKDAVAAGKEAEQVLSDLDRADIEEVVAAGDDEG